MTEMKHHTQIREARTEDAVPACHVLRRSIQEIGGSSLDSDDLKSCQDLGDKAPEKVQQWIESPDNYSIVAVADPDRVIGFGMLQNEGELKLCYVVPEYFHQGIGQTMLQTIERQAFGKMGLDCIRLVATVEARPFYEQHGYTLDGEPSKVGDVETKFPMIKHK